MKKILNILFIVTSLMSYSQTAINWAWQDSAIGNGTSLGLQIQVDKLNNTYVLGILSNGYLKIGSDSVFSSPACLFMTKFSQSGNPLWLKKIPSSDDLAVFSIDSISRIYIATADSLMKFDSGLNLLQVKNSSAPANIFAGANNRLFMFSSYSGQYSFGSYTTTCSGSEGLVMIEMDTLLNIVNSQKNDFPAGINHGNLRFDYDAAGYFYIFGRHFGNFSWFDGTSYTDNSGDTCLYFMKIKHNFSGVWAKKINVKQKSLFYNNNFITAIKSHGSDLSVAFIYDSLGIYAGNTFTNVPGNYILGANVLKLDTSGNYLGSYQLHCNTVNQPTINFSFVSKLQYDSNNNLYVMLIASDSLITLNGTPITSNYGVSNTGPITFYPFFLKFNSSGTLINTFKTGSVTMFNNSYYVNDVIVKDTGSIFYSSRTSGGNNNSSFYCASNRSTNSIITHIEKPTITGLNLFPNPVTTHLYINSGSNISLKKIKVYNIEGKAVATNIVTDAGGRQFINCETLNPGIYLIQIVLPDKTVTQKFIKE